MLVKPRHALFDCLLWICIRASWALGTLTVRELLQQNRFKDADHLAVASRPHLEPAAQSDAALASFIAGGSPEKALEVFVGLGYNESLPSDIRTAALRNAAHVETVRDGSSEKWTNFDRSYEHYQMVYDLYENQVRAFMNRGSGLVITPPHLIPLTTFDLDIGGRICTDPSLAPPETFHCGDKSDLSPSMTGGGAPTSALEAAVLRSGGVERGQSSGALGEIYLDMVRRSLANYLMSELNEEWKDIVLSNTAHLASGPGKCGDAQATACDYPFSLAYRAFGLAFNNFTKDFNRAHTSLSLATLLHLQLSVERVLSSGVEGDLIEAGVFRGGATIFMRAVLAAHELAQLPPPATAAAAAAGGESGATAAAGGGAPSVAPSRRRRVFVADSFAGIPPSRRAVADGLSEECDSWEERYAVSEEEVRANFRRYGLLDDRVVFLRGFFNESLPPVFSDHPSLRLLPPQLPPTVDIHHQERLQPPTSEPHPPPSPPTLAVVRIDADAYDGVRDALEALYPRLSPGGVLIIDDWHLVAAAAAAHEYRRAHGITSPIFLVPSDYVFTCSTGGQRVVGAAPGGAFAGKAGSPAGPEGILHCDHPATSLYLHNKHLVLSLRPHVAYWTKE